MTRRPLRTAVSTRAKNNVRPSAIAVHEAGHAVAGYVLNIPLKDVSINPTERFHGVVRLKRSVVGRLESETLNVAQDDTRERELVLTLAGPAAECRFTKRRNNVGARLDQKLVADVAQSLWNADERRATVYIRQIELRAKKLVDGEWAVIQRLAGVLCERRFMDEAALQRFFAFEQTAGHRQKTNDGKVSTQKSR